MNKKKNICHKLGGCIKKILLVSIVAVLAIAMSAFTAFAADNPLSAAGLSGGILYRVYKFFRIVSVPVAVIGAAMCAFSFFLPNEKGYDIAKKRLFNIGIALLVLMMIPIIYKYASSDSVRNFSWKANGVNSQIIENVDSGGSVDLRNIGPTPATQKEQDE